MAVSGAEVARTIVDLMTHGTLATVGDDQIPLGTYASYVLDSQGQPILRLRNEAVHTANLLRNPQCSLFIQPDDMPARILARATLIGKVSPDVLPAINPTWHMALRPISLACSSGLRQHR